jgi:hypothetical protein
MQKAALVMGIGERNMRECALAGAQAGDALPHPCCCWKRAAPRKSMLECDGSVWVELRRLCLKQFQRKSNGLFGSMSNLSQSILRYVRF